MGVDATTPMPTTTLQACSVIDGTSLSSTYPCACGSATCTTSNQVCLAASSSCQVSTTTPPIPPNLGPDCGAFDNWQSTFSPAKKQRCCSVWGRVPGLWEGPPESRSLCCEFHNLGCEAARVPPAWFHFNCTDNHKHWTLEWSHSKSIYCFYAGMMGAAHTTPSASGVIPGCRFRCTEGAVEKWSAAQTAWCCGSLMTEMPAVKRACRTLGHDFTYDYNASTYNASESTPNVDSLGSFNSRRLYLV